MVEEEEEGRGGIKSLTGFKKISNKNEIGERWRVRDIAIFWNSPPPPPPNPKIPRVSSLYRIFREKKRKRG